MEQKEIQLEEEKPQKPIKKHPIIGLIALSFGLLSVIISACLYNQANMPKIITCLYAISLIGLMFYLNLELDFKPLCFIFYPIILIYSLITSFAFTNEMVLFQLPILTVITILIYVIEKIFDYFRNKNLFNLILFSFIGIGSIVSISLININSSIISLVLIILTIVIFAIEIIYSSIRIAKAKEENKNS